jgi:hypothetical protein
LKVVAAQHLIPTCTGVGTCLASYTRFCSGNVPPVSASLFNSVGTAERFHLAGEEKLNGRAVLVPITGTEAGTLYQLTAMPSMAFEQVMPSPLAQVKTVAVLTDDTNPLGIVCVYVGDKRSVGNVAEKAGFTGGETRCIQVRDGSGGPMLQEDAGFGGFASSAVFRFGFSNIVAPGSGGHDNGVVAGGTTFRRPEDSAWAPDNHLFFAIDAEQQGHNASKNKTCQNTGIWSAGRCEARVNIGRVSTGAAKAVVRDVAVGVGLVVGMGVGICIGKRVTELAVTREDGLSFGVAPCVVPIVGGNGDGFGVGLGAAVQTDDGSVLHAHNDGFVEQFKQFSMRLQEVRLGGSGGTAPENRHPCKRNAAN